MTHTSSIAVNACHRCGATAYKPVLDRDATGAMRPNGTYRCVKCHLSFADIRQWRDGVASLESKVAVQVG